MKSEKIIDAVGKIDDELINRAEMRAAAFKKRPRRKLIPAAACIAAAVVLCVSMAFADDIFAGLSAYFSGTSENYKEELAVSGASVKNDVLELRIDGAAADERSVRMVVSFLLQEDADFDVGDLNCQENFDFYAVDKTGARVEFKNRESGTYVGGEMEKQAVSLLEDADMTYELGGVLEYGMSMNDIDKVCFSFEGLTLEMETEGKVMPLVKLRPEDEKNCSAEDVYISRCGFYYTVPENSDDMCSGTYLIRTDGTVLTYGKEDIGYSAGAETYGGSVIVSGAWGDTPVGIGLIDLDDYIGLEINGEKYLK